MLRACLKSRYWRAAGSCRPGMRGPASLHSPVLRQALKHLCLLILTLSLTRVSAADPEKATLAAGCFWCVEGIYERVPGVLEAVSGFSGGKLENPTYESHSDHTETFDVTFDPDKVLACLRLSSEFCTPPSRPKLRPRRQSPSYPRNPRQVSPRRTHARYLQTVRTHSPENNPQQKIQLK